MRTILGIDATVNALPVDELISAILAAPVDLLWNGGIGTYVKAARESQADVGDRSNDAVRIDAPRLRARVVGEGGNLGLTQAARIEYSLGGGLVNTDFIDNSAGVDTSDHEVNIKILLAGAIRAGVIPATARHQLLNDMTDEVAALVLRHNYGQNMALAAARSQASSLLHVHSRYLRKLVRDKRLDPEQDVLPGEREIAERRSAGRGRARLQPAGRPVPAPGARRVLPRSDAGQVRGPDAVTSATPRDHHYLGGQRDDRHVGHHVLVPADRGDRRISAQPDPGLAGGPGRVRHAGLLGSGGGTRGPGEPGRPDHAAARGP
jgi:hypothetical protein